MKIVLGIPNMPGELEQMLRLKTSVLGSFYSKKLTSVLLDLKSKGLWAMLDSGAFSWWNKNARMGSDEMNVAEMDWSRSKKFESYKREYIEWLKKNGNLVDVYVTLDVIHNPQRTWEIWKEMKDEGLDPMPVVHYETDYKFIEKYLEKGASYIGVGGLIGRKNIASEWIDGIFRNFVRVDEEGTFPKVHFFAATTPYLFKRYPLYSADSTSWKMICVYGQVPVPLVDRKGDFVFDAIMAVKVTKRKTQSTTQMPFMEYVKIVGEEVIRKIAREVFGEEMTPCEVEERLQDDVERSKWSIWYYKEMEKWWDGFKDWEVYKISNRKYFV